MTQMPAAIPESTKTSLGQRLRQRQRDRWPGLAGVTVRFRGRFAYVDGELETGELLPLCRLRYAGSASLWGFAVYLASRDGYEDSLLPSGLPIGSPEEALDCASGLYLADPSAWQEHLPPASSWPRTNFHTSALSLEDLESLEETLEILSNPQVASEMHEAQAEVAAGRTRRLTKDEAQSLINPQ